MERTHVPDDLAEANRRAGLGLDRVTYFVGGEKLLARAETRMTGWRSALYTLLARNEMQVTSDLGLPPAQVFEIGTQIEV